MTFATSSPSKSYPTSLAFNRRRLRRGPQSQARVRGGEDREQLPHGATSCVTKLIDRGLACVIVPRRVTAAVAVTHGHGQQHARDRLATCAREPRCSRSASCVLTELAVARQCRSRSPGKGGGSNFRFFPPDTWGQGRGTRGGCVRRARAAQRRRVSTNVSTTEEGSSQKQQGKESLSRNNHSPTRPRERALSGFTVE